MNEALNDAVIAQLNALRATLGAAVKQLDALAATALASMPPEPPQPAEAPAGCQHVRRLAAAEMGKPKQWVCEDCGHVGEE